MSIDVIGHAMRYKTERMEDAKQDKAHTTVPAFDAIRGQRSACMEKMSGLKAGGEIDGYVHILLRRDQ